MLWVTGQHLQDIAWNMGGQGCGSNTSIPGESFQPRDDVVGYREIGADLSFGPPFDSWARALERVASVYVADVFIAEIASFPRDDFGVIQHLQDIAWNMGVQGCGSRTCSSIHWATWGTMALPRHLSRSTRWGIP